MNEWEKILYCASARPELILKAHGMKRTLKTRIDPWGTVCLREYNWDFKRRVETLVRKSRGERIWEYSPVLLAKGIVVQRPLLFFEKRYAGVLVKTWVATRWLENKVDLGSLAMDTRFRSSRDFSLLLSKGAEMIARLHDANFLHGDLKWSNFLLVKDRSEMLLSDLDGIKRSSSRRLKAKDFARFVLSTFQYDLKEGVAEDLINTYLGASKDGSGILKRYVENWVSRRKAHYLNKPLLTDR
ncbi:MAG: hypothetical protein JRI39_05685 [Deltaproteobacteria bacterium]|nr:hypothetical protein [Deltaproteobacteria bacterium]